MYPHHGSMHGVLAIIITRDGVNGANSLDGIKSLSQDMIKWRRFKFLLCMVLMAQIRWMEQNVHHTWHDQVKRFKFLDSPLELSKDFLREPYGVLLVLIAYFSFPFLLKILLYLLKNIKKFM